MEPAEIQRDSTCSRGTTNLERGDQGWRLKAEAGIVSTQTMGVVNRSPSYPPNRVEKNTLKRLKPTTREETFFR